jgi:hypothetical protein
MGTMGVAVRSDELLDLVRDRESFLAYAVALAEERREAERVQAESQNPWYTAPGWQNDVISEFIEAGLSHFDPGPDGKVIVNPTWKDLAMFLWSGRYMEP